MKFRCHFFRKNFAVAYLEQVTTCIHLYGSTISKTNHDDEQKQAIFITKADKNMSKSNNGQLKKEDKLDKKIQTKML
jgi:hypothetical protein